ncbi:MAG: hypothetical protein H8E39_03125 [Alphaproteobacteria bacterium]|nr:hypothetical protein [Alphaproteobacteria bacterium]
MRRKTAAKKTVKKKTEDNTAWHAFVAWCLDRGLTAVPANPWTLSAYARWCEPQMPYKDIEKAFKTIFRVHNTKSRRRPDRDPLVLDTLKQIGEREKEKKSKAKEKIVPLFFEEDALHPEAPPKAKKGGAKKTTRKNDGGENGTATRAKSGKRKVLSGLSTSPKLVTKRKLKK